MANRRFNARLFPLGAVIVAMISLSQASMAEETAPEALAVEANFTYGPIGPRRPSSFFPGETVYVCLQASKLGISSDGKVDWSLQAEFANADGVVGQIVNPTRRSVPLHLGGATYTKAFYFPIPSNMAPGKYTVRIDFYDHVVRRRAVKSLPLEILDTSQFGVKDLVFAHNGRGVPSGGVFAVGQSAFLMFSIAGYALDNDRMDVDSELTILDANGTPLGTESIVASNAREISSAPNKFQKVPVKLRIPITRAGRFVLRLQLTDKIGDRRVEIDVPCVAVSPN